jgi:hypothetical protein
MQKVEIPSDRETWEGDIATYWFEEGLLVSLSKSPKRTVELIRANADLVKKITNDKRVPLLIYLSDSPVPDKATRQFSVETLPAIYSAMAMISKPGLSQLIMNILFKFKAPPIPMKSFTDVSEAKKWLRQYL